MQLPLLVSVTQLRRKTTGVLRQVADSGQPVFVTQYGSVELVLLTRRAYERLLRASERAVIPESAGEQTAAAQAGTRTDATADPLAVFGQLPRDTLFETRWGLVDRDTAAFFLDEGEEIRPHLSPERLRAGLDGLG